MIAKKRGEYTSCRTLGLLIYHLKIPRLLKTINTFGKLFQTYNI